MPAAWAGSRTLLPWYHCR